MRNPKKELEKVTMDRKIVEGLRERKSLTGIAKLTGKSKGYVIKIRDLALEYGYIEYVDDNKKILQSTSKSLPPYPEALFGWHDGRRDKLSDTDRLLEPWREWIKERLELSWSPQTIFEELSVAVPRSNFYRYLKRQNLMKHSGESNVMELIHAPGECLQVDWGKLFDVTENGKKKTVWIFIGTLGHSRYRMARVVEKLDFTTTIELIMNMLEELGGVPRKITCDNPKVFVQEASKYEPLVNPGFERFASHYKFVVEALPPSDPKKKGKVERQVPVTRRWFESYDRSAYSLESAQSHLDRKLKISNERKHDGHQQKPIEVLINNEAAALKTLPTLRYELETIHQATVRSDGYVRFNNKYYRIDSRLKKESALVIGNTKQVSIYCKGRLLEVYEKIQDKFITKACKDHYKESWEKTLNDHGHYLKQARSIGDNVERFICIILARGEGFVDTRVVWGLLTLNKKYHNDDIDKACHSALELSQVNLATVRQLLTIMARPKKKEIKEEQPITVQTMGGKFARPISEYKNHLRLVYSQASRKDT